MAQRSAIINSIAAKTMQSRMTGRGSVRKDPLIFQRDTALQLAIRLTMCRIVATLVFVFALLKNWDFLEGHTLRR
jgi:hypothetical protein